MLLLLLTIIIPTSIVYCDDRCHYGKAMRAVNTADDYCIYFFTPFHANRGDVSNDIFYTHVKTNAAEFLTKYTCQPRVLNALLSNKKPSVCAIGYTQIESEMKNVTNSQHHKKRMRDVFYCCCPAANCVTFMKDNLTTGYDVMNELYFQYITSHKLSAFEAANGEFVWFNGRRARIEPCYNQFHQRLQSELNRTLCMVRIETAPTAKDDGGWMVDDKVSRVIAGRLKYKDIYFGAIDTATLEYVDNAEVYLSSCNGSCRNYNNVSTWLNDSISNDVVDDRHGVDDQQCSIMRGYLQFKITCCCYSQPIECYRPFQIDNKGHQCAVYDFSLNGDNWKSFESDANMVFKSIDELVLHKKNVCRFDLNLMLANDRLQQLNVSMSGDDECAGDRTLFDNELTCYSRSNPFVCINSTEEKKALTSYQLTCCCRGKHLCNAAKETFSYWYLKTFSHRFMLCASDSMHFPFHSNFTNASVTCIRTLNPNNIDQQLDLLPGDNIDLVDSDDRHLWLNGYNGAAVNKCTLIEVFVRKSNTCLNDPDYPTYYPWMVVVCVCRSTQHAPQCDAKSTPDDQLNAVRYPYCKISPKPIHAIGKYASMNTWKTEFKSTRSNSSFWCFDRYEWSLSDANGDIESTVVSGIYDWTERVKYPQIDIALKCNHKHNATYHCHSHISGIVFITSENEQLSSER